MTHTEHPKMNHRLEQDGLILAVLEPTSSEFEFAFSGFETSIPYRMSELVCLRMIDRHLVLDSPCAHARLIIHSHLLLEVIFDLREQQTLHDCIQRHSAIPEAVIREIWELLFNCNALTTDEQQNATTDQDAADLWEFHDLMFHVNSRLGRRGGPIGGVYRLADTMPPLPERKPSLSADIVSLYRPDIESLKVNDVSLSRALEDRKSIRLCGENPISQEELGEFLYRTCRARHISNAKGDRYERGNRPYPSAGGCCELEVYALIHYCDPLQRDLYYYAPHEHELQRLSVPSSELERLLNGAKTAAAIEHPPQVLFVITARFQRVSWKYGSIALALTLKHVGVLYQTMYLVATAMNLAPCALGSGDSDLFSRILGTDYYSETSVGEFMLSSRK